MTLHSPFTTLNVINSFNYKGSTLPIVKKLKSRNSTFKIEVVHKALSSS